MPRLPFRLRRSAAAPPVDSLLADADRAEADGRYVEAIDALNEANRRAHRPEIEARLVRLRHLAFAQLDRRTEVTSWPPVHPELWPETSGIPEIARNELGTGVLGSALVNHGALLVRGLLAPEQLQRIIDGIDRAFAGRDEWELDRSVDAAPWFVPFVLPDGTELNREFVRKGGAVWTADSPRVLFELLEAYGDAGLDDMIAGYLGERPAVSLRKFTLRRVPGDLERADWHQDGAFLGDDVRSVNVWVALTECGEGADAPGLELVPRRLPGVLETGTSGAMFNWSISPDTVDRTLLEIDAPLVRPRFQAGDALLFDDLLVHRTAVAPGLTHDRYAIESWFFAPSVFPDDQIPLVF
jgi:hypothetical protein